MSWQQFQNLFSGIQKIGILGFGREGQSTYAALRKALPEATLHVCDRSELSATAMEMLRRDPLVSLFFGENYQEGIAGCQITVKTPGIPLRDLHPIVQQTRLVSQTELFLKLYGRQVVGITGTKGKSTTSSLLYHLLSHAGRKVKLTGNIGIPPLDLLGEIQPDDIVVFEMSSHQLEHCEVSPHISVLLNIFEEHLDHYVSYRHYQLAKMNIARWQGDSDVLIYNPGNEIVMGLISEVAPRSQHWTVGNPEFGQRKVYCTGANLQIDTTYSKLIIEGGCDSSPLLGTHNRLNICSAVAAAHQLGLSPEEIVSGLKSFRGLPHRLEFAGDRLGISFYNDSISTIPESTIAAVTTLPSTATLILGGFDRGVNYSQLIGFLDKSQVHTLVFLGNAGRRMYNEALLMNLLSQKNCLLPNSFEEAFYEAVQHTPSGRICLLSPAASSYDEFKNFEHRGSFFKSLIDSLR